MKRKTKQEPEEVKSKDGVVRRNLHRIRISAATPRPSNPSKRSQVRFTETFLQEFTSPDNSLSIDISMYTNFTFNVIV